MWLLIIFSESIGQTRVWISRCIAVAQLRKFFNMWPHFSSSQGAIQSYTQWFCMHHGNIKCFQRLPAQRPPARVGNGTTDHDRQLRSASLPEVFFCRKDGGLGV